MSKFVVIEGMDGSGKSTQTKRLAEYLMKTGYKVKMFHFPSGKGFYGKMINSFLKGEFGNVESVDPYFAAVLFAGDRREMAEQVREWLVEYDIVLFDRYAFSNIAYQCAKVSDVEEQNKLREWIYNIEFEMFKIPEPDISIFLDVPMYFVRNQLSNERTGDERNYLNGSSDIHEKDISLQYNVEKQYRIMCEKYDKITLLDCTNDEGRIIESNDIHKKVVRTLKSCGIL